MVQFHHHSMHVLRTHANVRLSIYSNSHFEMMNKEANSHQHAEKLAVMVYLKEVSK